MPVLVNSPFALPILDIEPDNGLALAKALCLHVSRLEQSDQHGGILSEGWSKGARASSTEDYKSGGYTSYYERQIVGMPEFADVHQAALDAFANYLTFMKRDEEPFCLSHSWVSSYGRGHFVPEHTHSYCHLSCVFYAAATDGTGNIVFKNPAHHAYDMLQTRDSYIFRSLYKLQPKVGHFLVFPSFMPHYTEPHGADEKRIVFSANMTLMRPNIVLADSPPNMRRAGRKPVVVRRYSYKK